MTPTPITPSLPLSPRLSRWAGGLFAGLALTTGLTLPFSTAHAAARTPLVVAHVASAPSPLPVRVSPAGRGGVRTAPLHYVLRTLAVGPSFSGNASWYGGSFQGRRTANGERFDTNELTAASKTLPFGTHLRVCRHGSCVVVRVNDRGPYVGHRILDLSRAASRAIGYSGVAYVTATPVETRRVAVRPAPVRVVPVRVVKPAPKPAVVAPEPVLAAVSAPVMVEDHMPSLLATVGFALLSLGGLVRGRRLR